MNHLNAEEVMKIIEIFHSKLLRKKGNEVMKQSFIIAC